MTCDCYEVIRHNYEQVGRGSLDSAHGSRAAGWRGKILEQLSAQEHVRGGSNAI